MNLGQIYMLSQVAQKNNLYCEGRMFKGLASTPISRRSQRLGRFPVSEMGIGTWAWGNQLVWGYEEKMDDEIRETFKLCVDAGINLFDTGDSYGTGKLEAQSEKVGFKNFMVCISFQTWCVFLFKRCSSHLTHENYFSLTQLLGKFLRELPPRTREQVQVATKLATYPWRLTPGQFVGAAKASRARVGGRLAVGQLHWSASNYAPWQEITLWDGLRAM